MSCSAFVWPLLVACMSGSVSDIKNTSLWTPVFEEVFKKVNKRVEHVCSNQHCINMAIRMHQRTVFNVINRDKKICSPSDNLADNCSENLRYIWKVLYGDAFDADVSFSYDTFYRYTLSSENVNFYARVLEAPEPALHKLPLQDTQIASE